MLWNARELNAMEYVVTTCAGAEAPDILTKLHHRPLAGLKRSVFGLFSIIFDVRDNF